MWKVRLEVNMKQWNEMSPEEQEAETVLFTQHPIEWLKRHQGMLENPFFDNPMTNFSEDDYSRMFAIQGNGVACILVQNADGTRTWYLEDTTGG
jgi:hypothetical protein